MAKFDEDKSERVSPSEANRFLNENIDVVGVLMNIDTQYEDTRKYLRAYFTYMLNFEATPDNSEDSVADLRFDYWKHSQNLWGFAADRASVAFVLSVLGSK